MTILSGTMEYTQERDRDFVSAYRRELRQAWERGEHLETAEMIRRAIDGGAPGFYVGFDYARRGVSDRLRRRLRSRHRNWTGVKRGIWDDLAERVEVEIMSSHARLRLPEALARVLAEGNAPRFYMSERTARRILQKMNGKTERK